MTPTFCRPTLSHSPRTRRSFWPTSSPATSGCSCLTFTVVNLAPTRQRLENDMFHGGRHRAEIQLRIEAAGLATGAGLCFLAGPGLERGGNSAGHDYQLHGDLHSLYDQGAPHGRAVPLLRHERTFPQRHYGGPEKTEIRERAVPGLYGLRQELCAQSVSCSTSFLPFPRIGLSL